MRQLASSRATRSPHLFASTDPCVIDEPSSVALKRFFDGLDELLCANGQLRCQNAPNTLFLVIKFDVIAEPALCI
jgi:hypothetical protein